MPTSACPRPARPRRHRRALLLSGVHRASGPYPRPRRARPRAGALRGEWLRRRRRLDAREQLRTAYDLLDAMGVEAFAERARRELTATGETARRRAVQSGEELTAETMTARPGLDWPVALASGGCERPPARTTLDLERFMVARIGARTVEVHSSHASPASHPDLVARLIRAAARVGTRG